MNIDDPFGGSSSGKQQHYAQKSAASDSHKQRLHGRKAMSWPVMTREIVCPRSLPFRFRRLNADDGPSMRQALLNHRYLGNN
jgi:hypothetical protein